MPPPSIQYTRTFESLLTDPMPTVTTMLPASDVTESFLLSIRYEPEYTASAMILSPFTFACAVSVASTALWLFSANTTWLAPSASSHTSEARETST